MVAFNVGVEIGQLLALSAILIVMSYWRRTRASGATLTPRTSSMMTAGFVLIGYQLTGYFINQRDKGSLHVQRRDSHPRRASASTAQLVKSTVIAVVAAAVILMTIVLPAEYAIDPTGIGRALTLTQMGEIKKQLAIEAEADRQAPIASRRRLRPTARSSLRPDRGRHCWFRPAMAHPNHDDDDEVAPGLKASATPSPSRRRAARPTRPSSRLQAQRGRRVQVDDGARRRRSILRGRPTAAT